MLRLALYANWHQSLCRIIIEAILFNTSGSKTVKGIGLDAIGRIFGQAAVDDFFGSGVILVVRQESGSTPVLMDSWSRLVKIADSSPAPYLRVRLERLSWPEDGFSLRD